MSIGTAGLVGLGLGGAALGGVVGGLGNNQNQSYSVNPTSLSPLGIQGSDAASLAFKNYIAMVNNANPYTMNANAGLAQMLQQYAQTGGLPNQQQIGAATDYGNSIFAPQQASLDNTFAKAQIDTNRQASNLGRSVNDPILQAKLAQYKAQQQGLLSGQQGAFTAQTAMSLPQQQLQYQTALANQAMQNQQSVLGLGQGLLSNAQQWSLATALRTQGAQSGGGLGGALSGLLGGLGKGLSLGNSMQNFRPGAQDNGDIQELMNDQNTSGGFSGNYSSFGGGQPNYSGPGLYGMGLGGAQPTFRFPT